MNIIRFEIKRNLKTTLIWAVAVAMVAALYSSMAPIFIDESDALIAYIQGMGDAFIKGVGIDIDTFFTPVGFLGYFGPFVALALAVQAMMYGIKAFVVEKNSKSIEFLYTKPNTRLNIFFQKSIANIVLLTITQVVVITSTYLVTDVINTVEYDHSLLLLLLCTFIPIQYLFYTLGTLIGVSVNKLKSTVSVALGLAMVMFFLNMLAGILGDDVFRYLSFFGYFNMSEITTNGSYDPLFTALSIGLIFGFTVLSAIIFKTKNMKVL